MRDVSTDDLVNSLLNSVTSGASSDSDASTTTEAPTSAPSSSSVSTGSSGSVSSSSSSSSGSSHAHVTTAPVTTSPATTSPATVRPSGSSGSSGSNESVTGQANTGSSDGGSGAGLSIGIAVGVLALVAATLLFLRARKRRANKERDSACSPPAGATCLTVPAGRGFTQEQRELGMPEMSIELPPGEHLGFSKGFDQSYASSARSSAASNPYSASASSDGSVFNTMGGVSPTFSSRKMASYSYQYRASSDEGLDAKPSLASARSASSTTFRLSQLTSNRGNTKLERVPSGRTLSAADEYAEMVSATNAHQHVDMDADAAKSTASADFTQSAASADFTGFASSNVTVVAADAAASKTSTAAPATSARSNAQPNELEMSMGPDSETNVRDVPIRVSATPSTVRSSEVSMGPDSPAEGRGKRSGSVYDSIPKLSGENMAATVAEEENMSASFLSEASETDDEQHAGAPSLGMLPLLQSMSSAESSDYGDFSSERGSSDSTYSTDSGSTQRAGSLIALNLEAKDGASEIAI